jgi:glucose-1-phosphate adenylyltransferase
MIIDAMGLILADSNHIQIGELTKPRALAAVPFAGRYRMIDFMLSNMVNTGMISIAVVTSNKYKSLMDHLGNGSAWDLSRKNKGLVILPPFINSESYLHSARCDADGLTGVLNYIQHNKNKYVFVAGCDALFNSTLSFMVDYHEEKDADMTVLYNRDNSKDTTHSLVLETKQDDEIETVYINPMRRVSDKISLGVVLIKRELLSDMISDSISQGDGQFSLDTLIRQHSRLKMFGIEYQGVCLRIHSVQSYFSATMELMDERVRNELLMSEQRIFTKVKDEAPSLYSSDCKVARSLISDGCSIYGDVMDSMLFRGVTIGRKSRITKSIIMQNVYISEGCELDHVIIDKNSILRPGIRLTGQPNYPVVIGKGSNV